MAQNNNLYDRQIRTFGIDANKKITSSTVLIYGLAKGLGTEIAKNLTLGGINTIYLYDDDIVNDNDIENGIYYTIGNIRSKSLVSKLIELNPMVNVKSVNNYNQKQNVTIVINQPIEIVNEINNYCRNNYSKMIVLYSGGICGAIFVDAHKNHIITDRTGENIENVQIGNINIDGIVICAPNSSHDFQTGDYIKIDNLEGHNIEQFNKEWKIIVINKTKFKLEDFNNIKPYTFINGSAIHINKSFEISHQSWQEQLNNPTIYNSFDIEKSKIIINTCLNLFSKKIIDNKYANIFNYELMPIVSLMGSIVSLEAIKLVTNKYTPISQWFTWSDDNLYPTEINNTKSKTVYGQLWGDEFENKLINSKWFIVGSGAIGCEIIKNLAFMNVATGNEGEIIITDPDIIEKSNLNRQFLFRNHHIGKHKSIIAAETIKQMKPNININIKTEIEKVGTENIEFTNRIMNLNLTGIINALDNTKARRFMDELCFKHNFPLFESGTTGTKGNTQPVIPFLTETYSNSTDPEQDKSFPICTIKSFPNEISHTIHWAMDQFEFFNRAPNILNKWIINPKIIDNFNPNEKIIAEDDINELTIKNPIQKTGIYGCIKWAIDMFNENYYKNIVKLLDLHPLNSVSDDGIKFWSGGKRCPKPIIFDYNNIDHILYVKSTYKILINISGLTDNLTDNDFMKIIKLDKVSNELYESKEELTPTFIPQIFEKDDDVHINWINASSNMRALNYGISIVDKYITKGIAGRIIPAIAATTSAVSGLIVIEMIKYLLGYNKIENYRSTFINLAEPIIIYSEPIKAPMININNININCWTKFEYKKDSNITEFKKFYDNIFKTNITMIAVDTTVIYSDFDGFNFIDKKLSETIINIFNIIPFSVLFSIVSDNPDVEFPPIYVTL
jgi:ubiquitin-activating enzyme E1